MDKEGGKTPTGVQEGDMTELAGEQHEGFHFWVDNIFSFTPGWL